MFKDLTYYAFHTMTVGSSRQTLEKNFTETSIFTMGENCFKSMRIKTVRYFYNQPIKQHKL